MENHFRNLTLSSYSITEFTRLLKPYSTFLNGLLSLIICYFIFDKFVNSEQLFLLFERVILSLSKDQNWILYALLFILIPVNWGIESKKWQILLRKIEKINFLNSFKSILTGLSINVIAPFGIGDAISRTYFLHTRKKHEAIGSILINRISQFLPTLFFGLIATVFLVNIANKELTYIIVIAILSIFYLVFFFAKIKLIYKFIQLQFNSFINKIMKSLYYYDLSDLIKICLLSIFRYGIFSFQFLLVFYIFEINLPMHVLLFGIFWIFLVKTITPTISIFSDLATRELSALFYFNFWGVGSLEITLVTLLIWIVNIILPSIVGVLFMSKLNFSNILPQND